MKLTREEALKLHKQMWSDMQKELGDCPTLEQRELFKYSWCYDNTPEAIPYANCYLCEYVAQTGKHCDDCTIDWGKSWGIRCIDGDVDYRYSPISKILALPERKENIGTN